MIHPDQYGYSKQPAHAKKIIIQMGDKRVKLEGNIEYRIIQGNLLATHFADQGIYDDGAKNVVEKGTRIAFALNHVAMIHNRRG